MADHSISISNAFNCFGPAPTTLWGTGTPYTMTWGSSLWGEGTEDLQVAIDKILSNTLDLAEPVLELAVGYNVFPENSFSLESETTNEGLQDGDGYSYVFPSDTTEAEDRDTPTYTEQSASTTSYTCGSVASTDWS